MTWAERSRAHFSQKPLGRTDETDETGVSRVLSVGDAALLQKLMQAAMRACDHHGDGPESREQMRREILETPPHLRADLLAHFEQSYPRA